MDGQYYSIYKKYVLLAFHWSIKMYTGLPMVIYLCIGLSLVICLYYVIF